MNTKESGLIAVYVIESPSKDDFYYDISEGKGLSEILRIEGIKSKYKIVTNKNHFKKALLEDFSSFVPTDSIPVLHISIHGSKQGIEFTDGAVMSWEELRDLLKPLNFSRFGLLLCLSACESSSAILMIKANDRLPFFDMVCNSERVFLRDGLIAYSVLYHNLERGFVSTFEEGVEKMKEASGNKNYIYVHGETMKNYMISRITASLQPPLVIQPLSAGPPPPPPPKF